MNKKNIIKITAIATSIFLLGALIGSVIRGEYDMATITTISNGESAAPIRSTINTNFSNINADVQTRVLSSYGELWLNGVILMLVGSETYFPLPYNLVLKNGSGMTLNSQSLKISIAGTYLINYSCTLRTSSATYLYTGISQNGTVLTNGITAHTTTTENSIINNCSVIEDLSVNDLITLNFKTSTPVNHIYFDYFYLTITKI